MLAEREDNPMNPPAVDASNDEAVKYNTELRNIMLQEQEKAKKGQTNDTMFIDVENTMAKLREDLSTVCKWVSIDANDINAGANPIDVLDKLVSMKFNWDTQGYYARAAFRGELDTTIRCSWAVLSTFYGATDPVVADKYQPELDNVKSALRQIASRPAGQSPEDVRKLNDRIYDKEKGYHNGNTYFNVYSPSLGFTIKRCSLHEGSRYLWNDERISNEKIDEYRRRLHGTPREDLVLAGLDVNKDARPTGIGFRNHAEEYDDRGYGLDFAPRYTHVSIRTTILTEGNEVKDFYTYSAKILGRDREDEVWELLYWFDRA